VLVDTGTPQGHLFFRGFDISGCGDCEEDHHAEEAGLGHWWILEVKRTEPWGYIPATGVGEGDTHSIMS